MWYLISLLLGAVLGFLVHYWIMEAKCRRCGSEYLEFP